MGRKLLGYNDAVKLLGGECKVVTALSSLAGASITGLSVGGVPAALGLFSLRDEIARFSQEAVKVLRRKLTGMGRFKRSELLEAAHAVLVVSAFFAALDDLDAELGTALNSASLELTKSEQAALASSSEPGVTGLVDLARELITPGRIPGLDAGVADRGRELADYYAALAHKVGRFATGTSVWDERDETTRQRWYRVLTKTLPGRALTRYQEQLVQLSGEFPEFAFWAHRVGIQTILDELSAARKDSTHLGITLETAAKLLATATRGPVPEKVRADLISRYRDQIAKPVAGVATIPDEVKLPSLQELYVTPSYRMMPWAKGGVERITESGWKGVSPRADLGAMVLEHLISTAAAQVPLVLLGQPGAGKSVFSQMLAAELDPRDYLVVRVELRSVPSDAGVQEQIEAGLTGLTGRPIRWPDLAEAAGVAQPVILLDGFDELLQASGVSHFDFLERVQAFQEREAELHRPVAVLVTSRTAVANQVRYPVGTPVARLEEFDDGQVKRWLSVWNEANPIRPLAAESALAQGALARQPLLLFLLALFHSGGGNLTPGISQAHLFERLFNSFVERDVAKLDSQLTEKEQQRAVQRDLDSLSMVAFAMFNRGRQSVTETDLIADLTALQPESGGLTGQSGRAAALNIAERMAGRFFFRLFVHRDEAMRGQQAMLSTYEFLHASFGEFLVGRWIVNELSRLSEQLRRAADDPYPSAPDDAKLHAMLAMAALSTREQRVLSFIEALLTEKRADELTDLRMFIRTLFHTCLRPRSHNPYPNYRPSAQTAPAAYAAYSANLVLLMLLIAEAEGRRTGELSRVKVSLSELHASGNTPPAQNQAIANFYGVTRLWHAQLSRSEWDSLIDVVRVCAIRLSDERTPEEIHEYAISLWGQDNRTRTISGYEILHDSHHAHLAGDDYVELGAPIGRALREAALLGATGYQGACTALLPYVCALDINDGTEVFQSGDSAASMLTLLVPTPRTSGAQRAAIYEDMFRHRQGVCATRLLLGQLRDDIHHLSPAELSKIAVAAAPYAWTHITVYLDIIAQVNRDQSQTKAHKTRRRSRVLDRLFAPLYLPDMFDAYSSDTREMTVRLDWRNVVEMVLNVSGRDLVTLLDPYNLRADEQEVHPLFELLGVRRPDDVVALMNLRDLFGLSDVRVLRNLYDIPPRSNELERSQRSDWPGWPDSPILQVALWTAMRQRGLPVLELPAPLRRSEVERLEAVVPNFVAQTRQLAAEGGVTDPLDAVAASSTIIRRGRRLRLAPLAGANERTLSARPCGAVARRAPGGPPKAEPGAAPGRGGAQRSRLDLNTARFGSTARYPGRRRRFVPKAA